MHLVQKPLQNLAMMENIYLLNGQKCWITNGGFANVYTVFAKVDGDKFTGFIIERGTEGFTQGPEEHKMGYQRFINCSIIFPGL